MNTPNIIIDLLSYCKNLFLLTLSIHAGISTIIVGNHLVLHCILILNPCLNLVGRVPDYRDNSHLLRRLTAAHVAAQRAREFEPNDRTRGN